MIEFLTVVAKHCRTAEHSPPLAAGFFNRNFFNELPCMQLQGMKTLAYIMLKEESDA